MLPGLISGGISLNPGCHMDQFFESFILLLRCPGISNISSIAESVIEDQLTTIVSSYNQMAEDGDNKNWVDESFPVCVKSRLFDDEGMVRLSGCEEVYWNALKDPEGTANHYTREAGGWVVELLNNNHEALLETSASFIVDSAVIIRHLPNAWAVEIKGARI